jgi:predicted O-methyltransferase YrrM
MPDSENAIPNIAEILSQVLRRIEPQLQPVLLARLERLAAHHGLKIREVLGVDPIPEVLEGDRPHVRVRGEGDL